MKKFFKALLFFLISLNVSGQNKVDNKLTFDKEKGEITISKDFLKNKIKGAWAAQTIGVTFGVPAEFKYNSTYIQDYQKLQWNDSSLAVEFRERPGTYDDI